MRLEEIYAQYFRRVYTFVLSLSRNEHTAEEITQETFFRIMKNPEAFQGRSSIDTYLCSIAHNLYVSSLRKRKREAADPDWEAIPDDGDLEGALTDRDTAVSVPAKLLSTPQTTISTGTVNLLGTLAMIVLPALTLAAGFIVWYLRRRR